MKSDPVGVPWLLSFVYSPTIWNEKPHFWYELECSGSIFDGLWLCLGDFNAVVSQQDKMGGRTVRNSSLSRSMSRFLWQTGVIDLGFSGNPFTWTNGREGSGLIMGRLDRGLGNGDWRQLFPRAIVRHLVRYASGHTPILLDTMGDFDQCPRPFRFEAFWALDHRSAQVVHDAWREDRAGALAYSLCQILKLLRWL